MAKALLVSESSDTPTLEAAIEAAQDGDKIIVDGGQHLLPVEIHKRIRLVGIDVPILRYQTRTILDTNRFGCPFEAFTFKPTDELRDQLASEAFNIEFSSTPNDEQIKSMEAFNIGFSRDNYDILLEEAEKNATKASLDKLF